VAFGMQYRLPTTYVWEAAPLGEISRRTENE
jgi:hypothetical protein